MFPSVQRQSPKKTILILLLIFIPLFVFLLGIPRIWDGDEGIYTEISHQMFIRHDYAAPYYNYNELRFDKPPLNFWINIFFYKLFGMNEFSSRLGSALFGLFGVVLVYKFGERLFNQRTGILAALILGTGCIYFVETQLALIDTTLTFFIAMTLYCFYRGYVDEKPLFLLIMGIPLGLGVLTKGPVAIVLPGGVGIVVWLYLTFKTRKKINQLFNWWLLGGFALAFVIFMPWYYAMWLRFKDSFLISHFGYHMFQRFTTTIESHGGRQWYWYLYYLVLLIIGMLPWSANLLSAFKLGIKNRTNRNIVFILVWLAIPFIFFTLSQTKLPGYVLPILPPSALLIGYWWDQVLADQKIRVNLWWGILVQLIVSLLLLVFILSQKSKIPAGYEDLFRIGMVLPASLIAGSVVTAVIYLKKNKAALFKTTFGVFYCFWIIFLLVLTQLGQGFQPVKELSADLKKHLGPRDKIVVNMLGADSAPFYIGRYVTITYEDQKVAELFRSKSRVYALVNQKTLDYLTQNQSPFFIVSHRARGFLISNRTLQK